MARFQDLSREDQELLNTDLGDFDKKAAEQVAATQYVYSQGSSFASHAADEFDKQASLEADDEIHLDEESKVASEEMGAFMARGYFDSLVKEGSDRHGDPLYYLMPLLEQKVASIGGVKMANKFTEFTNKARSHGGRAAGHARDAGKYIKEKVQSGYTKGKKAVTEHHSSMMDDFKGVNRYQGEGKMKGDIVKGNLHGMARAKQVGRGVLKASPYAVVGGSMLGGGAMVTRELNGKSKD